MSMLIATFEKSYGIQKHKLTDHVRRNQYMGHAVSFILITWDAPLLEDQNAPGLYFKGISRESFINLFSNGQNRWCSLPTHCIVLTATSLIGIAYSQSVCTIVAVILHTLFSQCCFSQCCLSRRAGCRTKHTGGNFDPALGVDPMLLCSGTNRAPSMATDQQLNHENSFKLAMDHMFLVVDADDRSETSFSDYQQGHLLMKILQPMREDALLAADIVLAKYTRIENKARSKLKFMESRGVGDTQQYADRLEAAQERLRAACAIHRVTETNVVHLVGITSFISLKKLDEFMTLMMVLHFCLLALYGSVQQYQTGKDLVVTGNTIFIGVYCIELIIRVLVYKGLGNFLHDRRGQEYQMQAQFTVFLVVYGVIVQILYYALGDAQTKLMMGLSCMQLTRVYMTSYSFRQITFCFVLGIPLVQVLVLLLAISIYLCTVMAYFFFQDIPDADGAALSFSTLEDSWLAMFQIFIGSDWHKIMNHAVDHTNRSLVWFFVAYVLGVGVLFSNLFVGILINMFQASVDCLLAEY